MEVIYDEIGKNYDTTRKADPLILKELTRLLEINPTDTYLDVGCGTGNYTSEIAKFGGSWFAIDHSEKMLKEAKAKSSIVDWHKMSVESLGFENGFFDGAITTLTIHHFHDLEKAFNEISRALKANSNFIIFTAAPEQMETYWLCHYFPDMMQKACLQMPTLNVIESAFSSSGLTLGQLEPFNITPNLKDFFLYSGKQKPEMYLSDRVRNGISSFHNFCSAKELECGLKMLKEDIGSGEIIKIIDQYQTSIGDYLFIKAKKS